LNDNHRPGGAKIADLVTWNHPRRKERLRQGQADQQINNRGRHLLHRPTDVEQRRQPGPQAVDAIGRY